MKANLKNALMRAFPVQWFIGIQATLYFVASTGVYLGNQAGEPYVQFNPDEAITQIGLPWALMGLWASLILTIIWAVVILRIHGAWLMLVPMALLWIYGLNSCPTFYMNELSRWGVLHSK